MQTPWPAGGLGALWPRASSFERAQKLWSVSPKGAKSTGGGEVSAQHPLPLGTCGLTYLDRPWRLPGEMFWFVNQRGAGIRG